MLHNKWHLRHLSDARLKSTWSKDPSTKVGAVIVDKNNRPISYGINGFPRKIKDTEERLNNRALKYPLTIHAELNAIFFARCSLEGSSLYVYPLMPCAQCASNISQVGISFVGYSMRDENINERWIESFRLSLEVFEESKIELVRFDLEGQCVIEHPLL